MRQYDKDWEMPDHNNISDKNKKLLYKSRSLPHMFDVDKPVFITYRLKFTIPESIMAELTQRKQEWLDTLANLQEIERSEHLKTKDIRYFAWFDDMIGQSRETPQFLHREDITSIIAKAFYYHDEKRYKLMAYCIMPNHVHVLIQPIAQDHGEIFSVQHIIYTWKRFTANAINRLMGRKGSLWLKESYDRMVRDDNELHKVVSYILENPVKAKLVEDWREWKGSYVCGELTPA